MSMSRVEDILQATIDRSSVGDLVPPRSRVEALLLQLKDVIENLDIPEDELEAAVATWLAAHPEATTTVEDGAITYAKLNSSLKGSIDDVGDLKTAINPTTTSAEFYDDDSWAVGYIGTTRITTTSSNTDIYSKTPTRVYAGETIAVHLARAVADQYLYFYYAWCDSEGIYTTRYGGSAKYTSKDDTYCYYDTTLTVPADGYYIMSYRHSTVSYEDHSSVVGTYVVSDLTAMKANIAENTADIATLETSVTGINSRLSNDVYYQFPNDDTLPICVCHRGLAVSGMPENTLVAFAAAKEAGWTWVETDIRQTTDGVWVCLHDASINRTARNADGTPLTSTVNIYDITYAQALEYDFGIYAGNDYAGIKVLTLDDFLNYCNKAHLYAQIEIKHSAWTQEEANTAWAIVQKYGMQRKVAWLCSSKGGPEKITNIDPYAPAVHTGDGDWTYIDPANFDTTTTYATKYMTGQNKVISERIASAFASVELQNNFIDFMHSKGIYAGVYGVDSVSTINGLSDRFDVVSGQYYKYDVTKASALSAMPE